jgi:hypothetical protein
MILENERVALWEFVLEPGARTPCHTHHGDYVFYVLEGSTLEVFGEHAEFLFAFEAGTGEAFAFACENGQLVSTDGGGLRAPATHSARNAGKRRYREILIETKR